MYIDDDFLITAAAVTITNQIDQAKKLWNRRFWVHPSLKSGKAKYNINDFMKDLISNVVDELNHELRCGSGFRNFFRMSSDFS